MHKYIRFPFFKTKAVTFSYDDGCVADLKTLAIFKKNNLKGTFNLNSGSMRLLWDDALFLRVDDVKRLFSNSKHELALHGKMHISMADYAEKDIINEVLEDKLYFERLFNRIIRGMAYPNASYDERVKKCLKMLGVCYGRTTNSIPDFMLPKDFLEWNPTCHHNDKKLFEYLDDFLSIEPSYFQKPLLFYLWGHSYEFDNDNNWDRLEEFCQKVSGKTNIWYATNMEIYEYVNACEQLVFSADNRIVHNPTLVDVYMSLDRKDVCIPSGKTVFL